MEFFVGTYTEGADASGKGIYHVRVDPEDIGGARVTLAAKAVNPSWLTLSPDGTHLLAVEERMKGEGAALRLFRVDGEALVPLARSALPGSDPCHIGWHESQPVAVTAHYSDGSLAVWTLRPEGGVLPSPQLIALSGSGPNKARQSEPHAHFAGFLDGGKRFAVADLGGDAVHVFRLDASGAGWAARVEQVVALPPGCGPRHMAISPDSSVIHVACELDDSVCTLVRGADGYRCIQHLPVFDRPPGQEGTVSAIQRTNDGHLLVGGRIQRQIARLKIEPDGVRVLGRMDCGGDWPRDLALSEPDSMLLSANQRGNTVTFLQLGADGSLKLLPGHIEIGSPAVIALLDR